MRFLTCRVCGHAYTASLSGVNSCPRCRTPARPGEEGGNRIERRDTGSHVLLTVTGHMYTIKDLEALKGHVDRVLEGEPASLAFHFDGATFLDSSSLAQLVRAVHEMTRRGRTTYVISGDPQVVENFEMLDLNRVLTLLPSLDAYRNALR
jgi:anti-anti-sigma factor